MDLVSFISSKNTQHDVVFKEAVQLLESMRSSPSCNRIAASRLVKSCQSVRVKINNIDPETYRILEHTRALYAARLAICELNGAGTHIPNACLPVTFPLPQKKGIFGFSLKSETPVNGVDPVPVQLLESCLKSLESRPQWWTSYSNSRQNAFVICQAARTENEKEELLNLHRSVVEGSNKLNQGLQEALRTAAAESLHHRAFVSEISNMNARLVHDMEETRSHFKAMIEKAFYEIESRAVSIVNTVTSVLGRVQAGVTNLDKVLVRVPSSTTQLTSNRIFRMHPPRSANCNTLFKTLWTKCCPQMNKLQLHINRMLYHTMNSPYPFGQSWSPYCKMIWLDYFIILKHSIPH